MNQRIEITKQNDSKTEILNLKQPIGCIDVYLHLSLMLSLNYAINSIKIIKMI